MNFSTSANAIFFGLFVFGSATSSLAFSPATISNSIASASLSKNNKGTQLNYIREVEMHGVALVLDSKDCLSLNKGEDKNPMEEAFDNMQHPMELMLLSRACIPYSSNTNMIKNCLPSLDDDNEDKDPMEEAFDNMQHPMELMLLSRACIPYVAM
jgi:hypothetical protein